MEVAENLQKKCQKSTKNGENIQEKRRTENINIQIQVIKFL